jgi:hypothetical protein
MRETKLLALIKHYWGADVDRFEAWADEAVKVSQLDGQFTIQLPPSPVSSLKKLRILADMVRYEGTRRIFPSVQSNSIPRLVIFALYAMYACQSPKTKPNVTEDILDSVCDLEKRNHLPLGKYNWRMMYMRIARLRLLMKLERLEDAAAYAVGELRELGLAPETTDEDSILTNPLIRQYFYQQCFIVLEKARRAKEWWCGAYAVETLQMVRRTDALTRGMWHLPAGALCHHRSMCQHLEYLNKLKLHWECITLGFDYAKRFYGTSPSGDFTTDMTQTHQRALLLIPVARSLCCIGLYGEAYTLAMECGKLDMLYLATDEQDSETALYLYMGRYDVDIDLIRAELNLVLTITEVNRGASDIAATRLRQTWEKLQSVRDNRTKLKDLLWWSCRVATFVHEDNGRVDEALAMDDFLSIYHHDVYHLHPDALRRAATRAVSRGLYGEGERHLRPLLKLFQQWTEVSCVSIPDPDLDSLLRAMVLLSSIYVHLGKDKKSVAITHDVEEWRLIEAGLREGISEETLQAGRRKAARRKTRRGKARKRQQQEDVANENDCPICCLEMEDKDDVHVTSCNHCFHRECIVAWAKKLVERNFSPNCPMCRTTIDVDTGNSL